MISWFLAKIAPLAYRRGFAQGVKKANGIDTKDILGDILESEIYELREKAGKEVLNFDAYSIGFTEGMKAFQSQRRLTPAELAEATRAICGESATTRE